MGWKIERDGREWVQTSEDKATLKSTCAFVYVTTQKRKAIDGEMDLVVSLVGQVNTNPLAHASWNILEEAHLCVSYKIEIPSNLLTA